MPPPSAVVGWRSFRAAHDASRAGPEKARAPRRRTPPPSERRFPLFRVKPHRSITTFLFSAHVASHRRTARACPASRHARRCPGSRPPSRPSSRQQNELFPAPGRAAHGERDEAFASRRMKCLGRRMRLSQRFVHVRAFGYLRAFGRMRPSVFVFVSFFHSLDSLWSERLPAGRRRARGLERNAPGAHRSGTDGRRRHAAQRSRPCAAGAAPAAPPEPPKHSGTTAWGSRPPP